MITSTAWLFLFDDTFIPFFISIVGANVVFAMAVCAIVKGAFLLEVGSTLLHPTLEHLEQLKVLAVLWLCSSLGFFCFIGVFLLNHPTVITSVPLTKLVFSFFGLATDFCTPFVLRAWVKEQVGESLIAAVRT